MSLKNLLEDPIVVDLLASKNLSYALLGHVNGRLCMLGASKHYRQTIGFSASERLLLERYGHSICAAWSESLRQELGWNGQVLIGQAWHKVQIWGRGQYGLLYERALKKSEMSPKDSHRSLSDPGATGLSAQSDQGAQETHSLSSHSTVLMVLDDRGKIIRANQDLLSFNRQQQGSLDGVEASNLVFRTDLGQFKRMLNQVRFKTETADGSFRLRNFKNEVLYFDWTAIGDGQHVTFVGKSSQVELEEALLKSEERINSILESMNDAFFAIDDHGCIAYINEKGAELLGKQTSGLLGRLLWDRAPDLKSTPLFGYLNKVKGQRAPESFQWEDFRSGHWYQVKTFPSEDLISAFFTDISDLKRTETTARHQAMHDSLTGLPNRLALKQTLSELIDEDQQVMGVRMGLLFIDLDGFKGINDTLGHNAGDLLLKEVATRLKSVVRSSDIVARLSGDEFVITLPYVSEREDAYSVGKKVVDVISQNAFELSRKRVYIGASVGVALYPDDAQDVDSLLKNADIAMYSAKQSGKNTVRVFQVEMSSQLHDKLSLEYQLHEAIKNDRFEVHYQPRFNVLNEVVGVEALARLRAPDGEIISPAQFIPLAEETGLIVPLGRIILKKACAWAVEINRKLERPIMMAVNVSGIQFLTGELPATIREIIQETGFAPSLLELELTETILMQHEARVIADLNELYDMGIRMSIDDFGTGYSSLSMLQKMPVQTIKLDRSFVMGLPEQKDSMVISRTVSALAKSMGLDLVAEGVETEAQKEFLIELGFDELQGFGLCRPLPQAQVEQFILGKNAAARRDNTALEQTAPTQ